MSLFIIFETITYILSGETFCIMFKTNSKNEDYQTEDSQTEDSQTEDSQTEDSQTEDSQTEE